MSNTVTGRGTFAEATVKVRVNGELFHTAAEGNGPVNALDNGPAQGAATDITHELAAFHLADYKVRILDGETAYRSHYPRVNRHTQ
jgi:2-isopropylmalate synthase